MEIKSIRELAVSELKTAFYANEKLREIVKECYADEVCFDVSEVLACFDSLAIENTYICGLIGGYIEIKDISLFIKGIEKICARVEEPIISETKIARIREMRKLRFAEITEEINSELETLCGELRDEVCCFVSTMYNNIHEIEKQFEFFMNIYVLIGEELYVNEDYTRLFREY